MTFAGIYRKASYIREPFGGLQNKEALSGRCSELMSYGVGLQVSCGVDPKYRKKVLYGKLRRELGPIIKELARQKESEVVEGKLVVDHVHVLLAVPPKYAVAQVIGFIKGKSAIHVARMSGRKRNFVGQSFWARGYCVSTIGIRRGGDTRVHPKAGRGRQETRPDEAVRERQIVAFRRLTH